MYADIEAAHRPQQSIPDAEAAKPEIEDRKAERKKREHEVNGAEDVGDEPVEDSMYSEGSHDGLTAHNL